MCADNFTCKTLPYNQPQFRQPQMQNPQSTDTTPSVSSCTRLDIVLPDNISQESGDATITYEERVSFEEGDAIVGDVINTDSDMQEELEPIPTPTMLLDQSEDANKEMSDHDEIINDDEIETSHGRKRCVPKKLNDYILN